MTASRPHCGLSSATTTNPSIVALSTVQTGPPAGEKLLSKRFCIGRFFPLPLFIPFHHSLELADQPLTNFLDILAGHLAVGFDRGQASLTLQVSASTLRNALAFAFDQSRFARFFSCGLFAATSLISFSRGNKFLPNEIGPRLRWETGPNHNFSLFLTCTQTA